MSKTKVISASLRTELHSGQAASSQPKPNDAFVDLRAADSSRNCGRLANCSRPSSRRLGGSGQQANLRRWSMDLA